MQIRKTWLQAKTEEGQRHSSAKSLALAFLRYDLLIKLNICCAGFWFHSTQHKFHGIGQVLKLSKNIRLWCYEWQRINGTLLCVWTGITCLKQAGCNIHPTGSSWRWMQNTVWCWVLVKFQVFLLFDNHICEAELPSQPIDMCFSKQKDIFLLITFHSF